MFIIAFFLLGPSYIFGTVVKMGNVLINPAPTARFDITVAENAVPYLSDIASDFGPVINNFPIFFIIFLLGSAYFVTRIFSKFEKKEKFLLVGTYCYMIFSAVFSRVSASSALNGNDFVSYLFYGSGMALFGLSLFYVYFKYEKENKKELFDSLRFESVLFLVLFFFTLISVKGAVRLVLVLVPPAAIMAAYLPVILYDRAMHSKGQNDNNKKMVYWVILVVVVIGMLYSASAFYSSSYGLANSYVPDSYTQQWQLAMAWVRENTPTTAVFAHWWDYGYWVQTMGQRATVLDGGNYNTYWDYLMGRYVLTEPSDMNALNFLYAHNTTNLLIDSTDIGKYPAYSSIGSDVNYDRESFIPTFSLNQQQTQEMSNSTIYVYQGGVSLDGDITYNENGTQVFLPAGQAGLAEIVVQRDNSSRIIAPPIGVFVYQGVQYQIPFRYAFSDGNLTDFGNSPGLLNSGIFIFSAVAPDSSGNIGFEPDAAALYLSQKTIDSEVARFYLFNENDPYFKLVHSQDSLVVSSLKSQGILTKNEDFVYYEGNFEGPIRIWQINYPKGMQVNQTDLLPDFPSYLKNVQ